MTASDPGRLLCSLAVERWNGRAVGRWDGGTVERASGRAGERRNPGVTGVTDERSRVDRSRLCEERRNVKGTPIWSGVPPTFPTLPTVVPSRSTVPPFHRPPFHRATA